MIYFFNVFLFIDFFEVRELTLIKISDMILLLVMELFFVKFYAFCQLKSN